MPQGSRGARRRLRFIKANQEPASFQLRLGHSKVESTARCLGIDVDDALEIAEWIEVWPESSRKAPGQGALSAKC